MIGEKLPLSKEILNEIDRVENATKDKKTLDFIIALNYGGRQEIVGAVSRLLNDAKEGKLSEVNENEINKRLYTNGIPDPDLLIRTSGEMRISNFLIWQLSYSEFYFSDALWPEFSEKHLKQAILTYQSRQRRFGGIEC